MIDLSGIEPDSLGPLHLEEIPLCSFTEKGRPYKPKAKKNKKKWRKEEEHRSKRKAEDQAEGERAGEDGEVSADIDNYKKRVSLCGRRNVVTVIDLVLCVFKHFMYYLCNFSFTFT